MEFWELVDRCLATKGWNSQRLAHAIGASEPDISTWRSRGHIPPGWFERMRRRLDFAGELGLLTPNDRLTLEKLRQSGVSVTTATRGGVPVLTDGFELELAMIAGHPRRLAEPDRLIDLCREMKQNTFEMVFTGSMMPVMFTNEAVREVSVQAVTRGAVFVFIGPDAKKYRRWQERGFDRLLAPSTFREEVAAFREVCAQRTGQLEAAERVMLIETNQCEHVRVSVAFSVFGQLDPLDAKAKVGGKLWAGVRYAEDEVDERDENTTVLWRLLWENTWSERRAMQSAAFTLRDEIARIEGRNDTLEDEQRASQDEALRNTVKQRQTRLCKRASALKRILPPFRQYFNTIRPKGAIMPLLPPEDYTDAAPSPAPTDNQGVDI